jgi:type I restriction enzyme S subunit
VAELAARGSNSLATGPFGSSISSKFFRTSGVPVIRGGNLSADSAIRLKDENLVFLSPEKAAEFSRSTVRSGDLVFTSWGTINQVGLIDESAAYDEYVISNKQMKLTPDPDVALPEFLYYFFSSPAMQHEILEGSIGSSIPGFNLTRLRSIEVQLPPVEEQRQIARMLLDAERLTETLQERILKKHAIKQGIMQQLLTGKTRLPGFTEPWKEVRLGTVSAVSRGASPRPIASSRWFSDSSSVGWVRIADLGRSDGMTLTSTTQRLSADGIARSRFLPAGTLIMSIAATVGVPIITGIDTCIHDGFVAIEKLRGVDKIYLLYVLKSQESKLRSAGQTGSQANVNTDIVSGLLISLPSEPEQVQIGKALRDADLELGSLRSRFLKAKDIKQGMMQELLTGRTRLPVAEAVS